MAVIPIQPIEVARSTTGSSPYILSLLEGAAQTFRPGAVLVLTTGGFVIEAAGNNPASIVGIALENGANLAAAGGPDGKQKTQVALAISSNVFIGNLDGVSANSDVGVTYGVEKTGNFWNVDKSGGTGNRKVLIQELDPRDQVGDTNGRVLFTFHPASSSFTYVS